MDPIQIKVDVARLGESLAMVLRSPDPPDPRCFVDKYVNVYIEPQKGGGQFPVCLQFEANLPITHVGFLLEGEKGPVPQCHRKGSCGGPFCLEKDIDPKSKITPLIWNDGPGTYPPTEYHFMLWFESGKPTGIDPQIYNEGSGAGPLWWRWLPRRLRAWLRSRRRR